MQVLTPAIPKALPENSSFFRAVPQILRNPMTMYTPIYYRDPFVRVTLGKRQLIQVTKPEYAQQILQDQESFGRSEFALRFLEPALGNGLLTAELPDWRPQRRAASPAFRAQALDRLVPTFTKAGEDMGKRLASQNNRRVDVAPEAIHATFDVIARTLLHGGNLPEHDADAIARDVTIFVSTVGRLSLTELFPLLGKVFPRRFFLPHYAKGQAAIRRLRYAARNIVEMRLADGGQVDEDDLMGLMINARDPDSGESLSAQQLVDNTLTFVGAGHETTAVALSWTLYILGHDQSLQDALFDELDNVTGGAPVSSEHLPHLKLFEAVLKESMRLFPPVPVIPRSVKKNVSIGPLLLQPDDHISVAVFPMHRHNDLWDDPHSFDPSRFLEGTAKGLHRYQYLPFGGGPRICIGMKFAMMEGVAILAEVIRRVRVGLPEGLEPEPQLAITMRPRDGMPLDIQAR